jgi:uncharacterized phage protein (TIGR01671 family)
MIPKFRAWLKNDKEMIDVDEIHWFNGELDIIGDYITFVRKADEIELMQSTGLKDKNGKEIFEGDIVKMAKDVYSKPTYYEVVRHRGGAYRLESKQHGCELWLRHTDCEVVGNIYENREFLEDK